MEKLQFKIEINAPISNVFDKMLGITNKSTYEQWTAMFNPTSTYEGNWEKGSKREKGRGNRKEKVEREKGKGKRREGSRKFTPSLSTKISSFFCLDFRIKI